MLKDPLTGLRRFLATESLLTLKRLGVFSKNVFSREKEKERKRKKKERERKRERDRDRDRESN